MAAETKAFSMALRNFLRGPEDDGKLRAELYELAESGVISQQQVGISILVGSIELASSAHIHELYLSISEQVEATMAASNRPMFCLSAMSATLRKVRLLLRIVCLTVQARRTCYRNACACAFA
tara:strand:- start:57 stop:425 length:369 start_codon:yes stop_codon:yes gene_type:complete